MEWVRITDEQIRALCRLEPQEAGIALRALLQENRAACKCTNCGTAYTVHGTVEGIEEAPCDVCGHVSLRLERRVA